MLKRIGSFVTNMIVIVTCILLVQAAYGADYESVKALVDKYNQAGDDNQRKEVFKKLSQTEPKTQEDMFNLRMVFSKKDWDEILFVGSAESVKKIKDTTLDKTLIEILKDEKQFIDKLSRKDFGGKSEKEVQYRMRNVEVVIHKLGEFKSQNAGPILKEYLAIPGAAYWASQALAMIGDKSASATMQEKAYKGEEINYAGQGSSEAMNVIRDLQDKSKKAQWPKIAKQIIHIKDRNAKPYLRQLFNHEQTYVRWEAADKFRAMADETDAPAILEMSNNQDDIIRAEAIHAMQKIKGIEFGDELIALLSDPAYNVRREAAKALGYKKIARAVPALEKALKDCEQRANSHVVGTNKYNDEIEVCDESYIALYKLTGKKYNYKGIRPIIEWKADPTSTSIFTK